MAWGIRKVGSGASSSYVGMAWAWQKVPDPPSSFATQAEATAVAKELSSFGEFEAFELH